MSKPENEELDLKESEFIGFYTHELSKKMKSFIQNLEAEEGVDPVAASQGWLIGYLYNNRDKELYQRDLEEKLHLAKSSIATILQTLEQSGYIRRETPPHDARQKKIVLTPEGCEFEQKMRRRLLAAEAQVRQGIPEKDLKVFFPVIRRMIENMK